MPRINHLTLEQAQDTLRAERLPFKVELMQSMVVPEGQLIAVSPRPGSNMEDGSEVVLTVSSGPPMARP
jgi:beta-lactam-binding protein with PASTA domain